MHRSPLHDDISRVLEVVFAPVIKNQNYFSLNCIACKNV
jgi:hypothetical protein